MTRLRTRVAHEGQKFVDEPIEGEVSTARPMASAVAQALGGAATRRITTTVGHERVWFRWMKGDGKGGLIPR